MPDTQIMVVEDESIIALDLKHSLNRLGYAVSGMAASGESALRKIEANRPDLIMMDIHLKGEMTGIQVAEKIKTDFQIPIVYLTANADSSTFRGAKETDPYGYLLKPFDEKELGIAVEIALHQHKKGQVIKSSESWYATAFQSLNEGVIATDADGLIVFMNAVAETMTGYSLVDARDQPVADVLTFKRKVKQLDCSEKINSVASILEAVMRRQTAVPLPHNALVESQSLETTPVKGSATAIQDALGSITGSIFMLQPIRESSFFGASVKSSPDEFEALDPYATINEASSTSQIEHDSDDIALVNEFIQAFIKKQPVLLCTANLIAESSNGSTTLKARNKQPIVTVQIINDKVTAVVKRDSAYWELVHFTLIEHNFFPISQRSNGTHHYQHRTIPDQCQLYHTSARELQEAWHGKSNLAQFSNKHVLNRLSREKIIVLRRGSWYRIQQLAYAKDCLRIKTIGGEIFIALEDSLIWGARA